MSYLSLLIAWIKTQGIEGDAYLYVYLQNLVAVEHWFFKTMTIIVLVVLAIAVGIFIASIVLKRQTGVAVSGTLGCTAAFFVFLPIFEWVTWRLAIGMASCVGPNGEVINQGKLVLHALLYLLIGAG